ncbi:MAG TPA: hypothetical protein VIG08_11725 [Gemmatimonadales bacterium]|jgi:hypothetical protein
MRWLGTTRQWQWILPSLVVLAAACGGSDGGTGPGGGGNDNLAGTYQLVGANDEPVPAVITSPICSPTQITNGTLTLGADGRWEMQFNWQGENGQDWSGDHGSYQARNGDLLFTSEAWGDQFEGEVDGGLVWLTWDFCNDNLGADLDLAFSR